MGGVGVEKTPAVGPDLLDGNLRSRGSPWNHLLRNRLIPAVDGALEPRHMDRRRQCLHDALGDEQDRERDGEGQENVEDRANHVDPVIADRCRSLSRKPADEGGEHRHAAGCGSEILNREPQHLRHVTHGRLAGIGLPICIRHEADRRVEGKNRRHTRQVLRVEGKKCLAALEQIKEKKPGRMEEQDGPGIILPVHLSFRMDPADPVDPSFKRTDDAAQEDRLSRIDPCHVRAERLYQEKQNGK